MKIKRVFVNCLIVLVAIVVGLLICEGGSRLFLDPVDYLSPSIVRDDILGIKLPPHSSGHDDWGFRNKQVPRSADIVTLGDSHTYGNAAKMSESWPHVLGRQAGMSVYNLGLGGYGPNQYSYLMSHRALGLNPRVIICGLYAGDDFDNALKITYGLDFWASLRNPEYSGKRKDWDIWEQPSLESWHKKARNWLSSHSMIYRLVVHGLMGGLKGSVQVRNASKFYGPTPTLAVKEKNILEAFQPRNILSGLDQDDEGVQEGMRLSFKLLREMNETCRGKNILFVVAVIPTKELVFSDYLEHNKSLPLSDIVDRLIVNERKARDKLFTAFREMNILYIDMFPQLKRTVDHEKLYANSALDMHPNKNGYRVIAETVVQFIKQSLTSTR